MAGVPIRVWIAVTIYAVLLATLATPLYDPFTTGDNDAWLLAVLAVAVHVGLGLAVARWWVLIAPVVAAGVGFFVADDAFGAFFLVLLGLPVALAVTAAACFGSRRLTRYAWPAALACFGLAALPAVAAAFETADRSQSPHLPARVQKQLPIRESLGNLCPYASTPKNLRRKLERSVDVLAREIRRDPDALVTYTYYYSDQAREEKRDITVRELAEEELSALRAGGENCRPDLQRKLKAVLDA
jgi:hypothetical protein